MEQEENLDEMISKGLRSAAKRRWWLLLPTVLGGLAACGVSRVLPNRYASEATILVEHQQVPTQYVTPNTTADIHETLLITTDAILSRTQLLKIIDEYNLYPDERKRLSREELAALMHGKIDIKALDEVGGAKSLNAFKISYIGPTPHLAQEVTLKLTTLFIQENDRSQGEQDRVTTQFLQEQVEAAAAELKKEEDQVAEFKMKNLGDLPEQQAGNLGILSGYQMQLQNAQAALGRAKEQRVYTESLLAQYQQMSATEVVTAGTGGTVTADPVQTIKAKLTDLRSQRAALLADHTEKYPDVVTIEEEIKESEALLASAEKKAPQPATDAGDKESTDTADSSANNAAMAQLKSQLQANQIEIQNNQALEKQLEEQIAEYRTRLNLTPVREQQLAELNRNYELTKKNYDDLLARKQASELATDLDQRQQGQRFTIIDQPSLPMKPAWPNHMAIALAGLGAGLALGVALVFILETQDHAVFNEKELGRFFSFPLMIGVPSLPTRAEVRRHSRMHVVEWVLGIALFLVVCASEFYVYRRG